MLAALVLVAAGSIGYAVTLDDGGDDEGFTELYVLPGGTNGTAVAGEYPTRLAVDEGGSLVTVVSNRERRPTDYTVVVELQRVRAGAAGDGSPDVVETVELDRFSVETAAGETRRTERTVTPTMTGEDLRLTVLLYRGDPPSDPTVENAYREVHLRVDVVSAENGSSGETSD